MDWSILLIKFLFSLFIFAIVLRATREHMEIDRIFDLGGHIYERVTKTVIYRLVDKILIFFIFTGSLIAVLSISIDSIGLTFGNLIGTVIIAVAAVFRCAWYDFINNFYFNKWTKEQRAIQGF